MNKFVDSLGINNPDEILAQYVELRSELRNIQQKLSELYPRALEAMEEAGEARQVANAVLTYRTRKTYKFTDNIYKLADELKLLKRHEIQSGAATIEAAKGMIYMRLIGDSHGHERHVDR